ncbi:antibiotic biosynthesis monooxygenase [Embleya sp. NPDC127516]|uniref:antibiotic biosynthesis monooxygenase n=1 Tax=Embleya sp. NPDC127516 TaxID=3363990 RepID=UPI00381D25E1
MTATPHHALPRVRRADVGTILVSPWIVHTPERQRAAVDATIAEWEGVPWPAGFLTLNCFVSTDGERVLNYAQWTGDDEHRAFMRTTRPKLVRGIDEVIPGIERPGVIRYRLTGSAIHPEYPATPTLIVIDDIEADTAPAARRWAELTLATAVRDHAPGPIATHVHINLDGTRGMAYTEWADAESYAASRAATGPSDPPDPVLPGVRSLDTRAYHLRKSLHRPTA